jgi:hypothetical protein
MAQRRVLAGVFALLRGLGGVVDDTGDALA